MNKFLLIFCLILTNLVASVSAQAQVPTQYTKNEIIQEDDFKYVIRGTFTAKGAPGGLHEDAYVLIGFEGVLQMGLLALDPVVSFKMRFKPLGGRVTIPNFDPGSNSYNTIALGQMPQAAIEKIDLNNVRVAFQFMEQTNEVVIVEDSGVFFGQGEWSFNVPDGYSWKNIFYDGGFGKLDYSNWPHIGADQAREMWNDIELDAFEVINADLLLSDLHSWYREHDTSGDYFATLRAIDRVRKGIEISYGFNVTPTISADILEASGVANDSLRAIRGESSPGEEQILNFGAPPDPMRDFEEATRRLRLILDKLSNLPDKLKIGNNHNPYRVAVRDIPKILDEPKAVRQRYRPTGLDPDTVARGYDGKFDAVQGTYKIARDSENRKIVVDQKTNTTVQQLGNKALILEKYLVELDKRYDCYDGNMPVPGLDPENLEAVITFDVPCQRRYGKISENYETNKDKESGNITGLMVNVYDGRREKYNPREPKPCTGRHFLVTARTFGTSFKYSLDFEKIQDIGEVSEREGYSAGDVLCLSRSKN